LTTVESIPTILDEGTAAKQMDDQQGNVIDGTARARQWRLARSKTHPSTDGAGTRSDAPKSIAGSLLVPADMLPAASPGDEYPNGDGQSRATERPPRPGASSADRGSDEDTLHQNPFLVPEAAAAASAARGTRLARRRVIAASLTRLVGATYGRRKSYRAPRRFGAMKHQRLGPVRLTGPVGLTLAAAAIALPAVIITQSHATHSSLPQGSVSGGSAEPLKAFESRALAADANPFGQRRSARDQASQRSRPVRAHRASSKHTRTRLASKAAAIPARYMPLASTGTGSSADSGASSSGNSGSTPRSPAPPAGHPASATGGSSSQTSTPAQRPAFGANGTLGPGHGNGTG
jgi:hypothetical protein